MFKRSLQIMTNLAITKTSFPRRNNVENGNCGKV